MRGQHRGFAQDADQFHHRQHADGSGHERGGYPADAGLPARDPARHHARAVGLKRQEGSDRRQRAGRDLRREGFACRLLPAPAGRDPSGRGEFHIARRAQGSAGRQPEIARRRGRRAGRRPAKGKPARPVHPEPEPARGRRQDRSADRARGRSRARDPDAVPPPQEQSAAGGRSRGRQDRSPKAWPGA
jgi:hypothetical protein